jgi:hypothetical protein
MFPQAGVAARKLDKCLKNNPLGSLTLLPRLILKHSSALLTEFINY